MEREALVLGLGELAVRFSKGWHEGIKIDALDIVLLNEAAEALAQPAQEPVAGTKTWFEDGKVVTQYLTAKDIYKEPAQEPVAVVAVNQSGGIRMEYQDGSAFDISKHVGQRFYTTPPQPAQEPVAWMVYTLDGASVCVTDNPADFTPEHRALPLYTIPPQRPWVGLTEKEKKEIYRLSVYVEGAISLTEAKLKEKNNG